MKRFVVRSPRQGLNAILHPVIARNFERAKRWRPKSKVAVLVPCAGTKPFPLAPSHRGGYLAALGEKDVDLWVVSEPLGVVPYEWSLKYPNAHYDFPPKHLRGAAREALVERVSDWLLTVAPKYDRVFTALPGHHLRLVKDAAAACGSELRANLLDASHDACLRRGACPPGHGRATSSRYRAFLERHVNPIRVRRKVRVKARPKGPRVKVLPPLEEARFGRGRFTTEQLELLEEVRASARRRVGPQPNPPPGDHEALGWVELDGAHHYVRDNRLHEELLRVARQGTLKEAVLLFDEGYEDLDEAIDWYVEYQPDDFFGEYVRVWFRFPQENPRGKRWVGAVEYVSPRERELTAREVMIRSIANAVKDGELRAVAQAARIMAPFVPERSILVPVPDSRGGYRGSLQLAAALAAMGKGDVRLLVARTKKVKGSTERRRSGKRGLTVEEHLKTLKLVCPVPKRRIVLIDNVVTTGATMDAVAHVLGRPKGIRGVAFAWAREVLKKGPKKKQAGSAKGRAAANPVEANPAADDGRYRFVHSCPGSTYEDIRDLRENEKPITRQTFARKLAPGQWKWIQRELGYGKHLPISQADWQIPYFKGTYRGVPAVFLVWSGMEYIFTLDGDLGPSAGDPSAPRLDLRPRRGESRWTKPNPIEATFGRRRERVDVQGPAWPGTLNYWTVSFADGEEGVVPAFDLYTSSGQRWLAPPPTSSSAWRNPPKRAKSCLEGKHVWDENGNCKRKGCPATKTGDLFGFQLDDPADMGPKEGEAFDLFEEDRGRDPWGRT